MFRQAECFVGLKIKNCFSKCKNLFDVFVFVCSDIYLLTFITVFAEVPGRLIPLLMVDQYGRIFSIKVIEYILLIF
jgi:hypothetical protein